MAFDYTNLYPDTSGNGGYTKSWNYTTVTDSIATCSASGYFNKVASRLGIGDNIVVAHVDAFETRTRTTLNEYAVLYVSGISNGVVTTTNSTTGFATSADVSAAAATAAAATALKANIASPTFTGVPLAPTAAVDTNTTQLATTAMVLAQATSATPLPNGVAAAGTSTRYARADHIHSALGTITNDNAAAGYIGEYLESSSAAHNASATVTMTIAAPCVVTWTGHKFTIGAAATAIKFSTTGTLPTNIVAGTTYYAKAIDANTLNVATTADNALAGTFVTTTGTQSGTHTGAIQVAVANATGQNIAALSLAAGDYEIDAQIFNAAAATTTVTFYQATLSLVSATIDRTFGRTTTLEYGGIALNSNELTSLNMPTARFSLSATTTVYLVVIDSFATSTMSASGWMRARRIR